jgi:hypothetical protein
MPVEGVLGMKRALLALMVGGVLLTAGTAGYAGAHQGQKAYPGTLWATPNELNAGDAFTVSGCGYNTAYGNVIIGFTGGSWGSSLDNEGCFTIAGIPALSGDTLDPGTYEVRAFQSVHNRWVETGETSVTVVAG